MISPRTWSPWDFNPPGLTSYLVLFEKTISGHYLETQLSLKEQSDHLQLRDCVRKNSNITAISVATGMHMKVEENKE